MADYLLPDVGEGLIEAEIVSWRVQVGDTVAVNEIVVEIETAKSLVELPSPYAGQVTALLVAEGETVAVGTPIISVGSDDSIDLSNPAATGSMEGATLVGRMKADRGPVRRQRRGPAPVASADPSLTQVAPVVSADPSLTQVAPEPRPQAKPAVRKLAREVGVDLAACVATGPEGRVVRDDVLAVLQGPTPPRAGQRETREPVRGVRMMMATAMVDSAFTAPHVTEWVTVDVTRTVQLVERLRSRPELRELPVGPLLVVARAVLLALRRHPGLNSTWDQAAQEVVVKHYVNLGIAADTPRGLVVPNVRDADALSLPDLAAALGDLVATARAGRTQPSATTGGTFTITNVGVFGVDAGTPIINPGEAAILCMGAIRRAPWVVVRDGVEQVVPRDVTTLALSFDHRHVDGASGSRFLADVAGILHDPGTALLF